MLYKYKGMEIRKAKKMTQDELCKKSNVSRQTLYELEKGLKTDVKMSTLAALAKALDCTVSDLFAQKI